MAFEPHKAYDVDPPAYLVDGHLLVSTSIRGYGLCTSEAIDVFLLTFYASLLPQPRCGMMPCFGFQPLSQSYFKLVID